MECAIVLRQTMSQYAELEDPASDEWARALGSVLKYNASLSEGTPAQDVLPVSAIELVNDPLRPPADEIPSDLSWRERRHAI